MASYFAQSTRLNARLASANCSFVGTAFTPMGRSQGYDTSA
jgi:hypothetical protein